MIFLMFVLLVGCVPPPAQKIEYTPPPKACIKVWSKTDNKVVYECLDTLDGPR
jgi:PBP1b-binding outer membrane lipoprotein LpoB